MSVLNHFPGEHRHEESSCCPFCQVTLARRLIFNQLWSGWKGSGYCRSAGSDIAAACFWVTSAIPLVNYSIEKEGFRIIFRRFSLGWGRYTHALRYQRKSSITEKTPTNHKPNKNKPTNKKRAKNYIYGNEKCPQTQCWLCCSILSCAISRQNVIAFLCSS